MNGSNAVNLQEGDRIEASWKVKRTTLKDKYTVVAADARKNFIVVNNGNYNTTLDKDEIVRGKVKIKLLSIKNGGDGICR